MPPSEEIERWATNRRATRLQHDIDKDLYKKMRQVKRAPNSRPTISRPTELQDKELSFQKTLQRHPVINNDALLKEQRQVIIYNKIVAQSEVTVRQQSTSRQLFISDKPIEVKDFLSWKEAGKTRTAEEEQLSKDGFTRHAFNQYASDRLGYFRVIPDTRHTL